MPDPPPLPSPILPHPSLAQLRHANRSLELTVRELQTRLTQAETEKFVVGSNKGGAGAGGETEEVGQPARRSRERELEEALIKSKKEKDRAVKVLISVLGKKQVAEFLTKHAGAPDILDSLCTHFQAIVTDNRENAGNVSSSSSSSRKAAVGGGLGVEGDAEGEGKKPAGKKRVPNNVIKKAAPMLGAGRSRSDEMYSASSQW